ncbi:MAG: SPOR domain-containing protein [Candidatus Krumholzibacteriaceae bacterium]|jgi:cell division protein FtsN
MRKRVVTMRREIVFAASVALLMVSTGCAPREMTGAAQRGAGGGSRPARETTSSAAPDTSRTRAASYDLEEEVPEKAPQGPAQLVERLEPVKSDTITVKDVAIEEKPKQLYSVGYRIQVFASGDRSAADRVKERVVAETRLSTYIDYEDGLYKVRAGDFAERKDAAQARLKLAGRYPGSWIVRTTIRQ